VESAARGVITDELRRRGVPDDLAGLPELITAVSRVIADIWNEDEPEVASERRYVKYSGDFKARAIVDFEEGWLQVETVATETPEAALRQAVVGALLTTRDMTVEDIFSGTEPPTGGEPFLYRQVLDAEGKPIRWEWRAERFADHLLSSRLRVRREHGRTVRSVRTDLVDNHLQLRELEYADDVLAAARRYRVPPSLIYGVIEVESAFNPYAISPAQAYGLMQVVPSTAGRDVYERIKKQPGEPTQQQLFRPAFNIDIGSAYLHLLDDVYLARIQDPASREHVMIASYNGGAGSTLRAFDTNRDRAIARINGMAPSAVYSHIVSRHPYGETRRYLEKVRVAERRYREAGD
jgi:membrane-bound lytic murein transglycosylase C